MNEKLLQQAISLVDKKISVIPVGKNKIPLISWKEFQSRYATHEEIKNWFEKYPDAQLGIVTGKISCLSVVDVEFGGDTSFLPQNTTIVATGGLGYHYYYQYCPGLQNKARIRELIDVRSEGGMVVAPGSESFKGKYELIKKLPTIPFPIHLFSDNVKSNNQQSAQQSIPIQQVGDELFDYPGFPEGQRNQETTKMIGTILSSTHPSRWDEKAWPLIQSFNQRNRPPLSDSELLTTFNSIRNREISSAPDKWSKKSEEQIKKEEEVLQDDSLDLMKLVADEQSKELDISTPMPTGYKRVDDALRGGFRIGDLIILSGLTGHGKTLMASNIAVNMAEHGEPVMFLTYEVFTAEVWSKIKEMGVSDDIKIFTPKCYTSGKLDWVKKKIHEGKEYGIKFIVIDHLEFLSSAGTKYQKNVNLNFSNAISEVVKEVKNLAKQEGVCILLLCHLRKVTPGGRPSINDLKDTSSISQEADAVILIERLPGGQETGEVFSPLSLLSLQKNRRTGKTCYDEVLFSGGRMVETEKMSVDKNNTEAKKASGEVVEKSEEDKNSIQGLLDMGFFSVGN